MFVWLASYPKSGNTWLRSMLAAYFFSNTGIYNFDLITNIKQFPETGLFKNLGIDIENEQEVIKNYIKVQENFNNKNSIQFLKTHSYLFNINNNAFTNLDNSLGAIYIVRDPRNVVTSWANFLGISNDEAADKLINAHALGGEKFNQDKKLERIVITYTGSWGSNYVSWKSFNTQGKYLLIKYENLIEHSDYIFRDVLKFIYKINGTKFKIDQNKFKNVIETTNFENMKKLEKKKGFVEARINHKTGKKSSFFNLGPKNDWKTNLEDNIRVKIEKAFQKEMIELGYL